MGLRASRAVRAGTMSAIGSMLSIVLGAAYAPMIFAGCSAKQETSAFDGGASIPDGGFGAGDVASICPGADCDNDGYDAPLDCNDNDALINPDAFDFAGDGKDNDCDGAVDNPITSCETTPAQLPGTPSDFARAADLCANRTVRKDGTVFDPLVKSDW